MAETCCTRGVQDVAPHNMWQLCPHTPVTTHAVQPVWMCVMLYAMCAHTHVSWFKHLSTCLVCGMQVLLYAMCHTCLGLHMSTCLVCHVFLKRLWCVV